VLVCGIWEFFYFGSFLYSLPWEGYDGWCNGREGFIEQQSRFIKPLPAPSRWEGMALPPMQYLNKQALAHVNQRMVDDIFSLCHPKLVSGSLRTSYLLSMWDAETSSA
jgi:hypothetical protein